MRNSKHLTLRVRAIDVRWESPLNNARFTVRNGDGLAQFSGTVRFSGIPKLTAMVFASRAPVERSSAK